MNSCSTTAPGACTTLAWSIASRPIIAARYQSDNLSAAALQDRNTSHISLDHAVRQIADEIVGIGGKHVIA